MCERDKRKGDCTLHVFTHTHTTCTHTLTACSLRHGRHGGLTHIRLEHRAGPGPRTRYHGSLSPHKPRPPPPSEFISKKEVFYAVMAQSLETWFTLSLTLYYVVTSPPFTTSSSPPLLLWAAENASHSSMQIRDAAGVKGRRGPTPSAAGLHRPRSRNDGTNLELRSSETWGECDSINLHNYFHKPIL